MTVIIPKEAYKTIVAASVRFANKRFSEDDWMEVYGVLIGRNEGTDVIVSKAHSITHQVKRPEDIIDKVYWNTEDYETFSIIDDEAFSRGEFTVGWWHSHPGFKVMMSQLDVKTTLSYQTNNPKAVSLVFNPIRLIRQVEVPERRGDPEKNLKNDPGFKIFRLDDVNRGIEASYHEVMYEIQGYDSMEQLVKQTQKFIIDVTNYFPKDNIFQRYEEIINRSIQELNSKITGTESYLKTLVQKGEAHRTTEVLQNQIKDIRKFVAQTYVKVEKIKDFLQYLEYKEQNRVIPKVKEILNRWDERAAQLNAKFEELANKY